MHSFAGFKCLFRRKGHPEKTLLFEKELRKGGVLPSDSEYNLRIKVRSILQVLFKTSYGFVERVFQNRHNQFQSTDFGLIQRPQNSSDIPKGFDNPCHF